MAERYEWYAVKTTPGAQQPQREYAVETTKALKSDGTPRGKGYRIIPSLNPNQSAIERALTLAGFTHYMPAEKRLIRDRRHTDLWKVRRFALLVGYVFILNPRNFEDLEVVPGVAGIVSTANGAPYRVQLSDILALRSAESACELDFDYRSQRARQTLRKNAKNDPRLQMLVKKLDIAGTLTVNFQTLAA